MPDYSIESSFNNKIVAGFDEAGRGAWAGPVVVGAVIINPLKDLSYIDDSKKITKTQRLTYANKILDDHDCSISLANEEEISELGINNAIFLAFNRALKNLKSKPDICIIDGNYKVQLNNCITKSIIKGDQLSVSIAAASIIAKVHRDNLISNIPIFSEKYDWANNSGYGTKSHISLIEKHGVSTYHRRNYKPIIKFLESQQPNFKGKC